MLCGTISSGCRDDAAGIVACHPAGSGDSIRAEDTGVFSDEVVGQDGVFGMGMGGFAGRQQWTDVEASRGEVEVGVLVILGAVGIAVHGLWCRRLQRIQQPGGAGFA